MATLQKTDKSNVYENMDKLEFSYTSSGNVEWYSYFRNIWFFKKLNIICQESKRSTSRDQPKRNGNKCPHKASMRLFTAALFKIAQNWKLNAP